MKLIGISGSLRKESYNTRLLQAAGELLPDGVSLDIVTCHDIPLYNGDLDGETKPDSVISLKAAIAKADGILFASPEYNYSFSGVLKNCIDWASRPAYKSVLAGKPAGIVCVAKGHVGGGRSHAHLMQVLSATLTPVVPAPPFLVPLSSETFDAQGALSDGVVRQKIQRYLADLVAWINRLE